MSERRRNEVNSYQIKDILPLTELQKSMIYCIMADPDTHCYFEQVRYRIHGELDVKLLEHAWNVVVEYNDNLRTVILWKGIRSPVQIILKKKELPFEAVDLSAVPDVEKDNYLDQQERIQWKRRVDITKNPFRVTLYKRDEFEYEILLTTHHSIIDGWSNGIILTELIDVYHKLYKRDTPERKCKNTYRAYIEWKLKQEKGQSLKFWRKYLSGTGKPAEIQADYRGADELCREISYRIEPAMLETVNEFIRSSGITFAVLFYGIWALLLSIGEKCIDTVFGITITERPGEIPGIDEMAGLFIKTLPFRIKCEKTGTVNAYLQRIQKNLLEWNHYSNVELNDLFYEGIVKSNCIQNVVVIQNYPLSGLLKRQEGLKFKVEFRSSLYQMNLGLTVGVKMFGNFVSMDFSYLEPVISECKVKQYINSIRTLLDCLKADHGRFSEMSLEQIGQLLKKPVTKSREETETALEQIRLLRGDDFSEIF